MVAGPFAWLRRNSQEQAREHGVGTTTLRGDSSSTHTEQGASVADAAVNLGGDTSYQPPDRSECNGEAASTAAAAPRRLLAGQHGWQLSADCTAPVVGVIGGRQIRFGGLVGVGSSGSSQVYRATWGPSSIEVAVKVTPFDSSSSSSSSSSSRAGTVPVEQQLQELEMLDHPNLVRTYCGVTFAAQQQQQQQQQRAEALSAAGHSSSTSGMSGRVPHLPKEHPDAANRSSSSSARDQQHRQQQPGSSSSSSSSSAIKAGLLQQQLQQCPAQAAPVEGIEAEMWLVQEFCDLGSLRDVSLEWQLTGEGDLQMFERLSLLVDAAVGLKHLHDKGLVHGDLTARNVMVSSSTQSTVRMAAKLTDVAGVCPCLKQQQRSINTVTTTSSSPTSGSKPDSSLSAGTTGSNAHTTVGVRELSHVAPERLRNPDGPAGPAQDVYSFGILMWEAFTGQQAYRKLRDAQHLYEAIVIQHLRPKIPDGMPADYQLLLERCWASDPADRPSADKLVGCLSVMAAERHRRINPHAAAALLEQLPGSPASVLRGQQQLQQRQRLSLGGGASVWRQGSGSGRGGGGGGTGMSRQCFSAGRLPVVGLSPRGAAGFAGTPPVGSLLLQHKSCPASAFEAFLQQSGSSLYGCSPKSVAGDRSDSFDAAAAAAAAAAGDPDAADAAVFAELQEEHEMLLQLRASSHTQSGPGSVPTLHSSQPHQRYADGYLDMQLSGLDDAHTWHI